ncbi:MAG: hypothetical protein IPN47_12930 [Gemmatimonadetes bacterium]|nr:hypothetical protein [Gemmatimonadota bacterium]
MKSLRSRPALLIAAAAIAAAATILALSPRIVLSQEADSTSGGRPRGTGDRALNIGANKTGISIGDSREWTGLRLNFRDTRLRRAIGINATIWDPKQGGAGTLPASPSASRLPAGGMCTESRWAAASRPPVNSSASASASSGLGPASGSAAS